MQAPRTCKTLFPTSAIRGVCQSLVSAVVLCGLALALGLAQAQTAGQSAQTAAGAASQAASAADRAASAAERAASSVDELRKLIPKSTSLKGDRLTMHSLAGGFLLKRDTESKVASTAQGASSPTPYFAPPQTKVVVSEEDGGTLTVRVRSTPCNKGEAGLGSAVSSALRIEVPVGDACKMDEAKRVKVGETYTVDLKTLSQYGFSQSGWTYGALLLPYKYRFRGDNKGLDPSPTIGPYLGWRLSEGVAGLSWVASAGLASIKVFDADGQDRTAQGMTWALGAMFDVSKSVRPFRSGLFFGRDYLGKRESSFKGGSWLALQIGFDFSE